MDDAKTRMPQVIPQVLQKLLPRRRITEILNDATLTEAVYIVAPYGCGKTLSVLSWLHECDRKAAWIGMDESCNEERGFVRHLEATIQPFIGKTNSEDILGNAQDTKAFLRAAALYLVSNTTGLDAVVIDDFHHINNADLLRYIKDFIGLLLGNLRVIIISRTQVPQVFNDFMLKRFIYLISIKELSFSLEEMTEYFNMNECPLPQQELIQIHDATEGWPAAINVILTISREGPVGYREDARSYIKGFFDMEIWEGLDDTIKDFLLKTSILEALTPASCNSVLATGATLPVLRWLFQNGLFIFRQEEEDTYRYHSVFRDFLLDKLSTSDIDEHELFRKVAWWYYEQEKYEHAFRYFFKAGDYYGISQTLRILSPVSMGGIDEYIKLTNCITELDMEDLKPYPIIVVKIAIMDFLVGEVEKMQSLLSVLSEWSAPGFLPISPEDYEELIWELGWLIYLDPQEPSSNQKHLDWVNTQSKLTNRGRLYQERFAVLCFPSMLRGVRDIGDDGYLKVQPILAQVEAGEKDIMDLEEAVWLTYLFLAEFYFEIERFAESEKIVRRIMAIVEEENYTHMYVICVALLVKIIMAVHDPKEIDALLTRLEAMIMANNDRFLLPNLHALQQRSRLASGIAGFTEVFLSENADYEDKPYFVLIYRHITFARVLLSTGEYSRAMIILGNLEMLCRKYNRPTDMMEVNMLKAIATYNLGDEDSACGFLMEALDYGSTDGYIRIFSDNAKDVWPVLEVVRKRSSNNYIERIAISCKKTLTRSGIKPAEKREGLTKKELKILRALQCGMSYKEIALDNNIQVSTVKSHVHSIYSKLDVNNRTAAVLAAQSMGIIEALSQAGQDEMIT